MEAYHALVLSPLKDIPRPQNHRSGYFDRYQNATDQECLAKIPRDAEAADGGRRRGELCHDRNACASEQEKLDR